MTLRPPLPRLVPLATASDAALRPGAADGAPAIRIDTEADAPLRFRAALTGLRRRPTLRRAGSAAQDPWIAGLVPPVRLSPSDTPYRFRKTLPVLRPTARDAVDRTGAAPGTLHDVRPNQSAELRTSVPPAGSDDPLVAASPAWSARRHATAVGAAVTASVAVHLALIGFLNAYLHRPPLEPGEDAVMVEIMFPRRIDAMVADTPSALLAPPVEVAPAAAIGQTEAAAVDALEPVAADEAAPPPPAAEVADVAPDAPVPIETAAADAVESTRAPAYAPETAAAAGPAASAEPTPVEAAIPAEPLAPALPAAAADLAPAAESPAAETVLAEALPELVPPQAAEAASSVPADAVAALITEAARVLPASPVAAEAASSAEVAQAEIAMAAAPEPVASAAEPIAPQAPPVAATSEPPPALAPTPEILAAATPAPDAAAVTPLAPAIPVEDAIQSLARENAPFRSIAPVVAGPTEPSPEHAAPGELLAPVVARAAPVPVEPAPIAAETAQVSAVEHAQALEALPDRSVADLPERVALLPTPRPAIARPAPAAEERADAPPRRAARHRAPRQAAAAPAASPSAAPLTPETISAGERVRYTRTLIRHVERRKHYPPAAARAGITGTLRLTVSIDRNGTLTSARVVSSSGHAILDDEAIAIARRAAPYPRPPEGFGGGKVSFTVTLRFGR